MIILDTNVISALIRESPDDQVRAWLDRQAPSSIWTTAITVLETRFGIARMPIGRRRAGLEQAFDRILVEDFQNRVLAFDQAAANETADIVARGASRGRVTELRDSMIAGIALSRRSSLATRNVKHFDHMPIDLINPWLS